MKLFEYAIIYVPTSKNKDKEPDKKAKIVKERTTILAKDEKSAGMVATRAIPTEYDDCLDDIQVVVRAF